MSLRPRAPRLFLAATLATLGLLVFFATLALAAETKPLKVEVTGPGTVASSPAGIECGNGPEACEAEFEEGIPLTLFANHSERTAFAGWGGACSGTEPTCEVTLSAATELSAEFEAIPQLPLTVNTTAGSGTGSVTGTSPGAEFTAIECGTGTGTETCTAPYNQGATIILFANRAVHSRFTGWTNCPNVLSANEYAASECEVQLSAATEVSAEFSAIPQAILEVSVEGPGELTSSLPGIACTASGGTCAEGFDTEGPESTLTLFATPAADNHFEEWGTGACEGETPECTVTMTVAHSVKAVFASTFQTLTVTPSGPGSLSATAPASGIAGCEEGPHGTCTAEYQEGSTVTLTATPGAHNHVTWTGCNKGVPTPDTCEVEIGPSETVVQAAFFINQHILTVASAGPGSLSASSGVIFHCQSFGGTCAGEYDEASTVTLTASPHAHYHVTWGAGECKPEPSADTCEVEIGPSDETLHAAFHPNPQTLTVIPTGPGSVRATSGAIQGCTEAGGTCSGPYIETATAILAATPGPGQAVAWQGCTALPHPNTCEVEIGPSATAVKAAFAPITHALTLDKAGSGQGQLTCNGAPCAAAYPEGTTLTIAANPASGSAFGGWSGGGCSGTGACQLTLQADNTITATFNANPPPAEESCVVPQLAGKTLGQARASLSAAHCSLGTVTKAKHRTGPLVVKSSSPTPGATLPAAGKVNLTLGPKPKKKGKK